jgi:hypothetical protein
VTVLLGEGHGAFARAVDVEVGVSAETIALGDVDGDHKIDLVVAGASAAATVRGVDVLRNVSK